MIFDYELTNEYDEPIAVLKVQAWFSPFTPAQTSGAFEDCYPAEGGELEDLAIVFKGKDITEHVDDLFGPNTYATIKKYALENHDPQKERLYADC